MGRFFSRQRFGEPQFVAALLLVAFLAQCVWLVDRELGRAGVNEAELFRVQQGLRQWHRAGIAGTPYCAPGRSPPENSAASAWEFNNAGGYDAYHSPLWYLTASAPLLLWRRPLERNPCRIGDGWRERPSWFSACCWAHRSGTCRAGSTATWAVGIALTLYCFSPAMLRASALWFAQPEMGAAWGALGAIFTAIAVAHTLYAPREVVVWNWRRIALLGLSLALAIGSQFSLLIVVPVALAFMLYLAPTRRGAAVAIWAAGCAVGCLLLVASYSFHAGAFLEGMRQARFFGISWPAFGMWVAYRQVLAQLVESSPALAVAAPAALLAYLAWPRARYFGNHAPLLVAVLFLFLAVGTPHQPGLGFQFVALPFLFVFVAGVSADLLETRHRNLVMGCVWGALLAQSVWNLWELAGLARG